MKNKVLGVYPGGEGKLQKNTGLEISKSCIDGLTEKIIEMRNAPTTEQIKLLEQVSNNLKINMCEDCFGRGKISYMQSAAVIGGKSVRVKDKEIKCSSCNGTGIVTVF